MDKTLLSCIEGEHPHFLRSGRTNALFQDFQVRLASAFLYLAADIPDFSDPEADIESPLTGIGPVTMPAVDITFRLPGASLRSALKLC